MITYIILGLLLLGLAFILKSKMGSSAYANITVGELKLLMKDKDTILIDVRTTNEVKQGMIPGALHMELGSSLNSKLPTLNKDKKYVVYCRSGNRSAMACRKMAKEGFSDVSNLSRGYTAWSKKS